MKGISADLPRTSAVWRRSPQTSQKRRQLGANLRRLPESAGSSEEISADFPDTSATRKKSPPTSRRCRQLGRDLRRLPDAVGSSEEISADFPTLSAARKRSPLTFRCLWEECLIREQKASNQMEIMVYRRLLFSI